MNPAAASPEALSITRHCIQACLHAALQARDHSLPFLGLLAGEDATIKHVLALDPDAAGEAELQAFAERHRLLIPFVTHDDGGAESESRLADLLARIGKRSSAGLTACIEMSHAGRLEIRIIDAKGREIPLTMLEDGPLYPQAANQ